ncbi:hypothetical protein PRDamber_22 [Enterobacteria phage PRDamber]
MKTAIFILAIMFAALLWLGREHCILCQWFKRITNGA